MTTDWPLVSVIVPVYNGENYINDCLRSILEQDYPAIEVIVVDDGSIDRTELIVRTFGNSVVYVRQDNSGSAVARNLGVKMSHGELLAFNDSDDLWAPHRLKQQVKFLRSQNVYKAVCGRFIEVPDNFSFREMADQDYFQDAIFDEANSGWTYLRVLEESIYQIDTLLMEKSLMSAIEFNSIYRRGQDFDFFLQLLHVTPIAQLENLYAFYRKSQTSITNKPDSRNFRAEILDAAVKKYGITDQLGRSLSVKRLNYLYAKSWFSHGYALYHAMWFQLAAKSFLASLKYDPRQIGAYKLLMLSYAGWFRDRTPTNAIN